MKTKDGHEVEIGHYYYLENGQQIILDNCATTQDGEDIFVVTPLYERTAVTCNVEGGVHNEVSVDYEHEGNPILVKAIFKEAPLEKLDEKYKNKVNEIEKLSLTLGELLSSIKEEKSKKLILVRETAEAERLFNFSAKKLENIKEGLNSINEKVIEKRNLLSELEDSISKMKNEDVSSLVSKTELQRLNKRDFKLECLEAGGVDNWAHYEDSLNAYCERYPE